LLPPERMLASELGVSRVVVREATQKLKQRGLVSIRQGIGVRVINNRSVPLQDAFNLLVPEERNRLSQCAQARLLIEPELAALAAQNPRAEPLRRLQAALERLQAEPDVKQAALHDIAFHEVIAEMAGNRVLALILTSLSELGRISREHTLREFGVRRAYDFHVKILSMIAARDPKGARRAMKKHLTAALGDIS
jgi:GntR family transcriptional regulator, transcriptional repressor for pyruvate dehydrogenase complex